MKLSNKICHIQGVGTTLKHVRANHTVNFKAKPEIYIPYTANHLRGKTFAVGCRIHYSLENICSKASIGFQVLKQRHVLFATLVEIDCGKTFMVV